MFGLTRINIKATKMNSMDFKSDVAINLNRTRFQVACDRIYAACQLRKRDYITAVIFKKDFTSSVNADVYFRIVVPTKATKKDIAEWLCKFLKSRNKDNKCVCETIDTACDKYTSTL